MSLSPRSAMRTGNCKTFKTVCYERHLSSYMEQLEDEYRWATSKVTRMIGEINSLRGQVHKMVTDYEMLRERSKSLEAERKQLLADDRARKRNETEEVTYLDDLIDHLIEMDSKIQLRPCFVKQPNKQYVSSSHRNPSKPKQ